MPFVNSSAMDRVEYEERTHQLDIWLSGSGRYSYFNVPAGIYHGLMAAPSKGQYYNAYIKDRFG